MEELDTLDYQLINLLQENGRATNTEIANEIGVSEGTVRRRYRNLIEEGVIKVVAIPDPSKLGRGTTAVTSTEEQPAFDPQMVQKIRQQKEFREKLHIAQELESVTLQKPKTFRVSNSKSKFAPIKRLMDRLSLSGMNNAVNLDRNVEAQQNKAPRPNRNNNTVEK